MSYRPSTSQSAISSELSDDDDSSRARSKVTSPLSQSSPPLSRTGTQLREAIPLASLLRYNGNDERSRANTVTSSRPDSPMSQVSKSHVPSLAAQGFLRPMSSQHLQAQRLGRPATSKTRPSISAEDDTRDFETETRRSLSTVRPEGQQALSVVLENNLPSASRGIEFSALVPPDGAPDAKPVRNSTTRSLGDSVRLLHERASSQRPKKPHHLNLSKSHEPGDSGDPISKSGPSFHSGLSLGAEHRSSREHGEARHHHLSSNSQSPGLGVTRDRFAFSKAPSFGKNHEYFEGNTVFFWGGRLQNARDRPVNIATAVLLVLPTILFFVFSFVSRFLPHTRD